MSSSLSGKVIAVTGAASGIGLATAQVLFSRGANLSLADVRKEGLDASVAAVLAAPFSGTGAPNAIYSTVVDVRSSSQVDAWIASTISRFGRLDGAANVAGVLGERFGLDNIADLPTTEWDFVIGVNLTGTFNCLRAQLSVISDHGSVVNVSSTAGLQGNAKGAAYCASKHGVIGLTKSAAREVGSRGVRVNSVAPGEVNTPMLNPFRELVNVSDDLAENPALGRAGEPEEIANLIAFLLGDESKFITGATYSIDGGHAC